MLKLFIYIDHLNTINYNNFIMLKGLALILLVSLVFSQQPIEGADIQGREEGKPLTPIGGGHMVYLK